MGTAARAPRREIAPPTRFVRVVSVLVALWCAIFAAINVWLELTDHFATGRHAADAAAISVVNWYVVVIKLVGVVAVLLSLVRRPSRFVAPVVGAVLWAGFATIGVYVAGSLVQAGLVLMRVVDAEALDAASIGYVLAFLVAAVGFGVVATSYSRRAGLGRGIALLGLLGAPMVLGSILVVLPTILRAMGLLTSS